MVPDSTMERLEDQIRWHDGRGKRSQRLFKWLKGAQIASAASIPVLTALRVSPWVAAALGGSIVAIEGVQQLNQYQNLWLNYRATAEALNHEKYLYLAQAGPYASKNDSHRLLAERIEVLISQEDQKWMRTRLQESEKPQGRTTGEETP
jgi:hypothetical protein